MISDILPRKQLKVIGVKQLNELSESKITNIDKQLLKIITQGYQLLSIENWDSKFYQKMLDKVEKKQLLRIFGDCYTAYITAHFIEEDQLYAGVVVATIILCLFPTL